MNLGNRWRKSNLRGILVPPYPSFISFLKICSFHFCCQKGLSYGNHRMLPQPVVVYFMIIRKLMPLKALILIYTFKYLKSQTTAPCNEMQTLCNKYQVAFSVTLSENYEK